jgi:pimeloyl-ACP methyl ester carboxylesterase
VTGRPVQVGPDRRELWARHDGSGPDVVLIAGIGDDHGVWDAVFDPLARRHQVTAFDNRGVGRSAFDVEPVSIEAMAADALALMRALGIERAHLVGSSMGAAIAQEAALAAPEVVASLALVGAWGERDEHLSRAIRHIGRLLGLLEDPVEAFDAVALWAYSGQAHADETVGGLLQAALVSDAPEQSLADFERTAMALVEHDPGERLAAIGAPTLVVTGSEDRLCPPRLGRRLADLIPDGRLEILVDRGHQPFQEVPGEFVDLLEEFWATV